MSFVRRASMMGRKFRPFQPWPWLVAGLLVLLLPAPLTVRTPTPPSTATEVVGSQFEAVVTRVKDGDSLLVRRQDTGHINEIRMAGIDAPEYSQPWGQKASSAMQKLVLGKPVRIEVTDKDRYHRLVARVWQGDIYVNAAMTRSGDAWAFDRYLVDADIRAGQNAAIKAGRGLWSLPPEDRLPPATWRARHPW